MLSYKRVNKLYNTEGFSPSKHTNEIFKSPTYLRKEGFGRWHHIVVTVPTESGRLIGKALSD